MAQGKRVGPEGLSRYSEDVGVQTVNIEYEENNSEDGFINSYEPVNNYYSAVEAQAEFIQNTDNVHASDTMEDLYQSVSQISINEHYQHPFGEVNPPAGTTSSHDVPVCLHQGTQGGSPVLITLPFQTMDNLQTFVPCSTCHQPFQSQSTSDRIQASETVAFCVSEVNIRTSQLTLVPCFLCWKPAYQSLDSVPNQIVVPLFPTLSTNSEESGASEESIRFVPCEVCLETDHNMVVPSATTPQGFEPASQPIPQRDSSSEKSRKNDRQYQNLDETNLSSTQTHFKPLRIGETGAIREFTTQTSPDFGISKQFDDTLDLPVAWFVPFSTGLEQSDEPLSLQRAFLKHCRPLIKNSKRRQREVPKMARLQLAKGSNAAPKQRILSSATRNQRTEKKSSTNTLSHPPYTHKEMRQQTEKVYRRLPESYEPQRQKLREELNQTHRLMAYLFQKKLQRATLKGKVSWQITESCL